MKAEIKILFVHLQIAARNPSREFCNAMFMDKQYSMPSRNAHDKYVALIPAWFCWYWSWLVWHRDTPVWVQWVAISQTTRLLPGGLPFLCGWGELLNPMPLKFCSEIIFWNICVHLKGFTEVWCRRILLFPEIKHCLYCDIWFGIDSIFTELVSINQPQ